MIGRSIAEEVLFGIAIDGARLEHFRCDFFDGAGGVRKASKAVKFALQSSAKL
uniref:Uncharacterized protein n=1 Tax=Arundo donax TaxID=35708 RepID=A0A0A9GT23_ARUDO